MDNDRIILFILYWHKLKTLNYITKLIMFSPNCVVTRNYTTAKNNLKLCNKYVAHDTIETVLQRTIRNKIFHLGNCDRQTPRTNVRGVI